MFERAKQEKPVHQADFFENLENDPKRPVTLKVHAPAVVVGPPALTQEEIWAIIASDERSPHMRAGTEPRGVLGSIGHRIQALRHERQMDRAFETHDREDS